MNNWQGLILFFLIVGVPALKQVADYLHRKKEARQIDKERSRREYDALRTGSPVSSAFGPSTPSVPFAPSGPSGPSGPSAQTRPDSQYTQSGQVNAADRLREIQAKRREAFERARKHANAGVDIAIGVATAGQPPITRRAPATRSMPQAGTAPGARPAPSGPRPTRRPPRQAAPGPLVGGRAPLPSRQPARSPTPQQRSGSMLPRVVFPSEQPIEPLLTRAGQRKRTKHAGLGMHSKMHRLIEDAESPSEAEQSPEVFTHTQIATMSVSDWRRAIVLQELLSKPIALRDE